MNFFLVNGLQFDSFISALSHNFSIKNRSEMRKILTDFHGETLACSLTDLRECRTCKYPFNIFKFGNI